LEQAERAVFARYDVAVEARYVELAEPRLRVRVIESGDGPPVILIPGDGAVAAAWAPLMGELGERRALVLDRPCFGLSDHFDYRAADLRHHGPALLASLLDALDLESAPIIGSSGGAEWSLWLGADRPERTSLLIPMGAPAVCLPGFRPNANMRLLSMPGLGRLLTALPSPSPQATGKMLASTDAHLPEHPEVVAAYHEAMRMRSFGQGTASIFRRSMRPGGHPRPENLLGDEELAAVTAPTLFVWGEKEPFGSPDAARRAAGLMPDASVEVIENAWHHPWLADAAGVGRIVRDFLDRHERV